MQQPLRAQVVGVGVAGSLAAKHPNAAAGAGPLAGRLHDLLVHAQRRRRNRFEVKVGVVAASRQGLAQAALQQPLGDAKFLKEIASVAGARLASGEATGFVVIPLVYASEPSGIGPRAVV